MVLVAKISAIAKGDDEARAKVIQKAKDNFLDPKWSHLLRFKLTVLSYHSDLSLV